MFVFSCYAPPKAIPQQRSNEPSVSESCGSMIRPMWLANLRHIWLSSKHPVESTREQINASGQSLLSPAPQQNTSSQSQYLISISCRVILRTNHKTSSLFRTLVNRLDDIDQLLFILQYPIQLVVITGPKIAHHVLVSEEEHQGHRVVEFVHLFEIGHLVQVADVDNGKIFDAVGNSYSRGKKEERRCQSLCILKMNRPDKSGGSEREESGNR